MTYARYLCPRCGQVQEEPFPFCDQDGTPDPPVRPGRRGRPVPRGCHHLRGIPPAQCLATRNAPCPGIDGRVHRRAPHGRRPPHRPAARGYRRRPGQPPCTRPAHRPGYRCDPARPANHDGTDRVLRGRPPLYLDGRTPRRVRTRRPAGTRIQRGRRVPVPAGPVALHGARSIAPGPRPARNETNRRVPGRLLPPLPASGPARDPVQPMPPLR